MNLASRSLTKKEAIDLMMKEPNLIRRPIVIAGRKGSFGYNPAEYDDMA